MNTGAFYLYDPHFAHSVVHNQIIDIDDLTMKDFINEAKIKEEEEKVRNEAKHLVHKAGEDLAKVNKLAAERYQEYKKDFSNKGQAPERTAK